MSCRAVLHLFSFRRFQTYTAPGIKPQNAEERVLDEVGIQFVKRCIEVLESRGLEEQGIYRVVGVTSKVNNLLKMGLDRRKTDRLVNLDDPQEWETKTITSALKNYLRNLPEPLMTHRYHNGFIAAVSKYLNLFKFEIFQSLAQKKIFYRQNDQNFLFFWFILRLFSRKWNVAAKSEWRPHFDIPNTKSELRSIETAHKTPHQVNEIFLIFLNNYPTNPKYFSVAAKSEKNLMTISNLGVCFGPTLLRPEEETVASIMDLKFYNVVVEILITHYDKIFNSEPERTQLSSERAPLAEKTSPQASGYNSVNNSMNNSGHISPTEHLNNVHYLGSDLQEVYAGNVRSYNSNTLHPSVRQTVNYTAQQPYTCVSINCYLWKVTLRKKKCNILRLNVFLRKIITYFYMCFRRWGRITNLRRPRTSLRAYTTSTILPMGARCMEWRAVNTSVPWIIITWRSSDSVRDSVLVLRRSRKPIFQTCTVTVPPISPSTID